MPTKYSLPNYLSTEQARRRHRTIAKSYAQAPPTLGNLFNAAKHYLKGIGVLEAEGTGVQTGIAPIGNMNNKSNINILKSLKKPIPKSKQRYASVSRSQDDRLDVVRSQPIVDIFRFQIPSFKTGSLGFGHKYRSIGNNKGLKDVIKNGVVPKNHAYKKADQVYWSEREPFREYSRNSALMLSYDKNGKYIFGRGNFDNPVSSASNPISFYDDAVTLHGRYPFSSVYHEIPKTPEGIKHANTLGYLNRFVERPIRNGVPLYFLYKYYNNR